MSDLIETLRLACDDPMWANHVEMPKRLLRHTIDRLVSLQAENESLQAENEQLMKALSEQIDRDIPGIFPPERVLADRSGAVKVKALLDEGLEILNGIIDSVKRHGNYSPESTCVFIDQAGGCLREALSALTTEPAAPKGATTETRRGKSREDLHKHEPDTGPDFLAGEQSGETSPSAPEGGRQEAVAWWVHDLHVARLPVKAKGIGPEPTEYLYPADREQHARDMARMLGGECSPLYTRPAEQAVTEAGTEEGAKLITKWLGFAWDGLGDGRIADRGFPIFTHGQFGWVFQGSRGDMIDLAHSVLEAALARKEGKP